MSARSSLAELITAAAPTTWDVIPYPTKLAPLDRHGKPVAIVIEQRTLQAGKTSPTATEIPVDVELTVWVIVDASLGRDRNDVEDILEDAAFEMIRILEQLPDDNWDGVATRNQYDEQKPAYDFTIRAQGSITQEDTP